MKIFKGMVFVMLALALTTIFGEEITSSVEWNKIPPQQSQSVYMQEYDDEDEDEEYDDNNDEDEGDMEEEEDYRVK
jgi:hypothetical protein